MKTFKKYLQEEQLKFNLNLVEMSGIVTKLGAKELDQKFIDRALGQQYFDLKPKDFQSLKYKKEIQYIIAKNWFPKFDLTRLKKGVNVKHLNGIIKDLRSENRKNFEELFKYQKSGIGPGEVMIYFLIDDASVQGGASAGVDIVLIDGQQYELKGANVSGDKKYLYNFKLGGTGGDAKLIAKAVDLRDKLGLKSKGKGKQEVNATMQAAIAKAYPKEWAAIKKEYVDSAHKYFEGMKVIFFNNNKSSKKDPDTGKPVSILGNSSGDIATIKKEIKKSDLLLHTITSGVIKPKIKI